MKISGINQDGIKRPVSSVRMTRSGTKVAPDVARARYRLAEALHEQRIIAQFHEKPSRLQLKLQERMDGLAAALMERQPKLTYADAMRKVVAGYPELRKLSETAQAGAAPTRITGHIKPQTLDEVAEMAEDGAATTGMAVQCPKCGTAARAHADDIAALAADPLKILKCGACGQAHRPSDKDLADAAASADADAVAADDEEAMDEGSADADALEELDEADALDEDDAAILNQPTHLGDVTCGNCSRKFAATTTDGTSCDMRCPRCFCVASTRDLKQRPSQRRALAAREAKARGKMPKRAATFLDDEGYRRDLERLMAHRLRRD